MINFSVKHPLFLINKYKCVNNIKKIASKATAHNLLFRPHFKSHQSAEIGNWFRGFAVSAITVSSVQMAQYFAQNGWQDITIAFPVNIREIDEINRLASEIKLNCLIESTTTASFLKQHLTHKIGTFIEIDTGYHRTGISSENQNEVYRVLQILKSSDKMKFMGFLTHSGHSYSARSKEDILNIHKDTLKKIRKLRGDFLPDHPNLKISIGDTPCCSVADDFKGVDEIRPGNFIFYDVMQHFIGSNSIDEIAVCLACPVVAKYEDRNEIVIHGGAVHLSKEFVLDEHGNKIFGLIVKITENGWTKPISNMYLCNLSQEHGVVKSTCTNFNEFNIGDVIGILPIHSCLTANLMKSNTIILY